jgi:adenylate kinase family enzyme
VKRIVIIGIMASGKTTLAAKLSQCLQIPHIETDTLLWGPNWERTPNDEFDRQLEKLTQANEWVAEGGHRTSLAWERADTLIWLDYSVRVV